MSPEIEIGGDREAALTGTRGRSVAGDGGIALAGGLGTAISGDDGIAMSGHFGCAVAGNRGIALTGRFGTAIAGVSGAAQAGIGGEIAIAGIDENGVRYVVTAGIDPVDGPSPDVLYVLDDHRFVVESPVHELYDAVGAR